MIGLFVDGWAHNNLDQIETFFTPWHALFYSGFTATALWIAWLVARQRPPAGPGARRSRRGYGGAVAGVIVFGIGGVGDWLWHTIFGIEVSIDALLSPTHLVLLTGMLLIFSGPLRSAWADPVEPEGLRSFLAPLLAATLSASLLTFFFMYASGLNTDMPGMLYFPETDFNWEWVALGVISILWTTLLLVGPMVFLMRRWTPPFGSFTLMFGVVGVLMASIFAFEAPLDIVPPLVAGLAADVIVRIVRAGPTNPRGVRWAGRTDPGGAVVRPLRRHRRHRWWDRLAPRGLVGDDLLRRPPRARARPPRLPSPAPGCFPARERGCKTGGRDLR